MAAGEPMKIAGFVVLAVGGFICGLNFYLSYIRYLLFRLAGRRAEFRFISGVPIVGSLIVILSLVGFHLPRWAWIVGIALAALDTGGIHWFVGSVAWHEMKNAAGSKSEN